MNYAASLRPRPLVTFLTALALAAATLQAQTNGTWTNLNGGSWPVTTNWSGGVVADGTGAVADFSTLNITATRTVTLDGPRTVGTLIFRDNTTASNDWVLNTGSAGPLTLDVSVGGQAVIQVLNRTVTIGAVLAGDDGINVTGNTPTGTSGTVIFNAANTFTGGLTVSGAIAQLNNASAAGSNTITIATFTNSASANKLQINGGVTIANDIIINNASPLAGAGAIQQVGTGQATVNGVITINNSTANGGHFVGGTAVGNELVLNGPMTSSVGIVHRAGRVLYSGGGTGYTGMTITGTALLGVNNGISSVASLTLGISGNGTLDLNGFDQSVTGLTFGNPAAANINSIGTAVVGARTLTVAGNLETRGDPTHNITGTGTLNLGATNSTFTINDAPVPQELIVAPVISGTGGFSKDGAGTLMLSGPVTNTGPLAVNAGTLLMNNTSTSSGSVTVNGGSLSGGTTFGGPATITGFGTLSPGTLSTSGSMTMPSLTFDAGATLLMNVGTANDLINVTAADGLRANGSTTLKILAVGGPLPVGTTNLITHAGAIQGNGLSGFTLTGVGHATAALEDAGGALRLNVSQASDTVVWTGAGDATTWDTSAVQNWKFQTGGASTSYLDGDDVRFQDLGVPIPTTVLLGAGLTPSRVVVDNTAANPFTFGGGTISGPTALTKQGPGTLVLQNVNSYTGATNVNAGTLDLDFDGGALNDPLDPNAGTSVVNVAAGATFKLTRDDAGFTFARNLSGTGNVEVNPHSVAGGTTSHSVFLSGANTAFTGNLRLLSPLSGTYRIQSPSPASLGGSTIEIQDGAQILTATNQTYTNNLSITGTGFVDTGGNIGALRLEAGSVWAGNVFVNGAARIGAHNVTATVSGNISGGDLTVNATNFNNSSTLIFTGTNSYDETIIGGQNTQTAGPPSMRLNIGNGGTTGTLGAGNVTINGDGANGVLGFDRSDGYTLAAGQTITGGGPNLNRTFIDIDTLGAGFSDNASTITLGIPDATGGGNIRIAQARANAIGNFSGALTTGAFRVSTGQTGGVANFNSGAVINANTLYVGEAANLGGTVNQAAGATVSVAQQLRVGHFGTETSTYNMNGGTLTLTGVSPNLSPSTAGAGAANATGDNNINAAATSPTIVGGGIYLGIDGTGIFNQNGGTVTTNWIVLDNRGDTGAGANMSGLDQYNLGAGTLNIRSNWGIIGRNASTEFRLNGGTVRVDNTGTGTGAGPNITIPFDAPIRTSGSSTLDTNGAGNGFTLTRSLVGTGSVALIGGGTINLNPSTGAYQTISPALSGANPMVKLGAGTTLLAGSGSGYSGPITVSAGRLNLPADLAAASLTVADAAAVAGEPTIPSATLGATTGSTVFFDGNTANALTATNLVANGITSLDFATVPTVTAPWKALGYGTKSGTGTFAVANAANYRTAVATDDGVGSVTVNVTRKNLLWTGTASSAWDVNATMNWHDGAADEKFFAADTVAFGDAGSGIVTINAPVSPWGVSVNSANAYTFNGVGGITGPGGLTKAGSGTLTLSTTNSYAGQTAVNGGVLSFGTSANLGDQSPTNTIALSGGGTLNATASVDLGANRSLSIGTGGGAITVTNTAAQTVTIPGNITGSEPLRLGSGGAGAATFVFNGNNSGYSGNITVDSAGGGLSTLRLGSSNAVTGGTLTLDDPTTGASGAANTLDLNGATLPATVTLSLNSTLDVTTSYRTQVISNVPGSTINAPIQVNGSSIIQFLSAAPNGMTINGNVTPGPAGFNASSSVFFIRGSGTGVVNGTINLPGAIVAKTDASTWTINSSVGNDWATTRVLNAGSVKIGANNALPIGATLEIGQGSDASNSSFDLNGFNQEVARLVYVPGNASSTRGVTNTSATLSTLTVNNANDDTYGTNTGITGGLITGNLALVKKGLGSLTLGAVGNSHTGPTTVEAGSLLITGSVSASPITVNAGAILGGTGAVSAVNVLGGSVLPGINGPGTFSTGAFSLNANSFLKFELSTPGIIGGGVNDLLSIAGPLTLDGTLEVTELPGFGAGTYRLANYTGSFTDNELKLDPTFFANNPGAFIDTATLGQINLVVVPEPGSLTSLGAVLAMLVGLRRFRSGKMKIGARG